MHCTAIHPCTLLGFARPHPHSPPLAFSLHRQVGPAGTLRSPSPLLSRPVIKLKPAWAWLLEPGPGGDGRPTSAVLPVTAAAAAAECPPRPGGLRGRGQGEATRRSPNLPLHSKLKQEGSRCLLPPTPAAPPPRAHFRPQARRRPRSPPRAIPWVPQADFP